MHTWEGRNGGGKTGGNGEKLPEQNSMILQPDIFSLVFDDGGVRWGRTCVPPRSITVQSVEDVDDNQSSLRSASTNIWRNLMIHMARLEGSGK